MKKTDESWMQTFTGKAIDPMNMCPEDVSFHDIAHSLAYQTRYAGHFPKHYSIAEHCVLIHDFIQAWERSESLDAICPPNQNTELALWGLLHDASEAYLVDVPRPVKVHLPQYKEIEARVQSKIITAARRYVGVLSACEPLHVQFLDRQILVYEVVAAWGDRAHKEWFELYGRPRQDLRPYLTPKFWKPERARYEYEKRLAAYGLVPWPKRPAFLRWR